MKTYIKNQNQAQLLTLVEVSEKVLDILLKPKAISYIAETYVSIVFIFVRNVRTILKSLRLIIINMSFLQFYFSGIESSSTNNNIRFGEMLHGHSSYMG